MTRTGMMRRALGGLIGIVMLATAACSSEANTAAASGGAGTSGTGTTAEGGTGASGSADPLVGIWESAPYTAADVDANLRDQFKASAVDEMEGLGGCLPKEGETRVTTLHFGAGQLVVSVSKDGSPPREDWTGAYAVQNPDTFATGDGDNLYITVDYTIEGDQLFTDLIADRLPDHSPWSVAQDGPGHKIVSKPLADRMCQAEIYETTPFTKAG